MSKLPDIASPSLEPCYLGIECGGTQTTALLLNRELHIIQRWQGGPANSRLIPDADLLRHFQEISAALPMPDGVGIGMAGIRGPADVQRLERIARQVWPQIPLWTGHDLESGLAAAGDMKKQHAAQVLVLSGTGSCCFGRNRKGDTAKIGGWGHILGDKGSGYEIGLRALKAVVYYYDREGQWPRLGQAILQCLCLNEPDELIDWVQRAGKQNVAALAKRVFSAAGKRDPIARDILEGAASTLAEDAVSCARRLGAKNQTVEFIFNGGILLGQPAFANRVCRLILAKLPRAIVRSLHREGAWGAARNAALLGPAQPASAILPSAPKPSARQSAPAKPPPTSEMFHPQKAGESPTEQRHPRSMKLDTMNVDRAVQLMLSEDETIPGAIRKQQRCVARLIDWVTKAFSSHGRLFYVGAGTSGRLGVLDASECPPTFRAPPDLVQGIMAGGQIALWQSVEGAEDDLEAGARAVQFRGIGPRDVVVGIAASGKTPFVWGALWQSRQVHAKTALLCFNPALQIKKKHRPDLLIVPDLGPEILTGSTRLKCGTATKLILNMVTTLAMVRAGKVVSNLMIDLHPTNEKLRDRAVRIVGILTGAGTEKARKVLEKEGWLVKEAVSKLDREKKGCSSPPTDHSREA